MASSSASAGVAIKGHGTGGVRTEHASEKRLQKGKAWAGSNEKKEKKTKINGDHSGKQLLIYGIGRLALANGIPK